MSMKIANRRSQNRRTALAHEELCFVGVGKLGLCDHSKAFLASFQAGFDDCQSMGYARMLQRAHRPSSTSTATPIFVARSMWTLH